MSSIPENSNEKLRINIQALPAAVDMKKVQQKVTKG